MVLLGDVLAVVATLFGVTFSAWATLLAFSLMFPGRAGRSADAIRRSPGKMVLRGLLITGVLGFAGVVLLSSPAPMAKLVGWLFLLSLLSLSALGASGLATVLGARVREQEPELSAYAALMRGAALVVLPGLLPVFGWFLVAPTVIVLGVGAGTLALRMPKAQMG